MSIPGAAQDWSDDLKAQTHDMFEAHDILLAPGGRVCLKHVTSGFGTIAEDDAPRGALRVTDRQTGVETTFASVDELIAAGWVID